MSKTDQLGCQLSDTETHNALPLPSSSSKDARAIRSGVALREALLTLLEQKSFEQITIRDVCAEAGVHYATFFRHHATKESLLDDIALTQLAQLNDLTLAVRNATDYRSGFQALCIYVDEHRLLWSTLLNGGAGPTMREEWVRHCKRVADNEPPSSSWLPRELGTVCAATLIAETLAWWVAQPKEAFSPDDVADILLRLLSTTIMATE